MFVTFKNYCKRDKARANSVIDQLSVILKTQPFGYWLDGCDITLNIMPRYIFNKAYGKNWLGYDGVCSDLGDRSYEISIVYLDNKYNACMKLCLHELTHCLQFQSEYDTPLSFGYSRYGVCNNRYNECFVDNTIKQILSEEYDDLLDPEYSISSIEEWLPCALGEYLYSKTWRYYHRYTSMFFRDRGFYPIRHLTKYD